MARQLILLRAESQVPAFPKLSSEDILNHRNLLLLFFLVVIIKVNFVHHPLSYFLLVGQVQIVALGKIFQVFPMERESDPRPLYPLIV
jgi:hypothetical protein